MKYKTMIYKDYMKKYMGLNKLHFEWKSFEMHQYGGLLMVYYRIDCLYDSKKDVSYIMIAPMGYLSIFGVSDNEECYVVRLEGKHMDPDAEFGTLSPFFEELQKNWYEKREKES